MPYPSIFGYNIVKMEVETYLSLVAYCRTHFVYSDIRHTDTHGQLASRQCSRFNCQRIDSGYLLISGGEVRELQLSQSVHQLIRMTYHKAAWMDSNKKGCSLQWWQKLAQIITTGWYNSSPATSLLLTTGGDGLGVVKTAADEVISKG